MCRSFPVLDEKGVSENHATRSFVIVIVAAFTKNGSALPIHLDVVTDLSSSLFFGQRIASTYTHTQLLCFYFLELPLLPNR